ncbi:MAG: pyridoxamine kinase [Clostridiales bacterium]|nr:pyridoxamine kinase [Clostridiales bacterium]
MEYAINRPLQCAAVHDLSGFGRCSLTVALPVLSAMGVQVSCLPTAVLSTHTGGFKGYTFRDLTADMGPFFRHWQREGFRFDALYTGYLGSEEQIQLVEEFLSVFRTDENCILVDPVMGDHGKLYTLYTEKMAAGMKRLCARADVIVPNMTEAAYLTGMEYRAEGHTEAYLQEMCEKLMALGPGKVVLTGVCPEKGRMGTACFEGGKMRIYAPARVDAAYDGTGDLFASVLLGALLRGRSLTKAVMLAADFTRDCVERSLHNGTDCHHGVDFEPALWRLGKAMMEEI